MSLRSIINIVLITIMIIYMPAFATVIKIPEDYQTIQEGLNNHSEGDTILVQPGIYYENLSDSSTTFTLASRYIITGDTADISSTKIDGGGSGHIAKFAGYYYDPSYMIGFTIQNGQDLKGGGLYIQHSYFTISNNIFIDNNVISDGVDKACGGGIYSAGYETIIENNIFIDNTAEYNLFKDGVGGAVYICNGDAYIYNNTFYDNTSFGNTSGGGAVYCINTNVDLRGNIFSENTSNWGAAAYIFVSGTTNVINNLVFNNYGGGILLNYFRNSLIANNTIVSNFWAGGLTCIDAINPLFLNNIIRDNETYEILINSSIYPTVIYNNISGGWDGIGNIDNDPLFRDPDNDDYHLMATYCGDPYDSPCIDIGHPESIDTLMDCNWGLGDSRSDMGAYGGGDYETVDIEEQTYLPESYSLLTSYPNPFNASTTISFTLPEQTEASIAIYDITGRLVKSFGKRTYPAGASSINWHAEGLTSGIYFVNLNAEYITNTRRVLLLK